MKGPCGHLLNPKSHPSGYWLPLPTTLDPAALPTTAETNKDPRGRSEKVGCTQDSFGIWVLRCHGNQQQKTTTLIVIVLLKGEGGG